MVVCENLIGYRSCGRYWYFVLVGFPPSLRVMEHIAITGTSIHNIIVCVCELIFWLHHWCSLSKKSMNAFPIRIRSYQVVNFAVNVSLKSYGIIGVICGSVDG